jgi:hypothetical protein
LVEDGLERIIVGVAEELMELATEDGAVDLFFGKERWVCRGDKEASGRRWGHERGWAGPYIVGLEGTGTEMLARWVDDCHGSVLSNSVGESLSGQGPEADELDLGLWDVVDQDQWGQVRAATMCGRYDATVSATDWKRFWELDRVDDIEDVEGAVERGGAVQVPEERGRVGHVGRGIEEVHTVVVEVLCIVGRWANCSGRSDGRIGCFGGKEDGMSKLDLLLRRGSMGIVACCSRRESRRSGCRVGGCSCSRAIW